MSPGNPWRRRRSDDALCAGAHDRRRDRADGGNLGRLRRHLDGAPLPASAWSCPGGYAPAIVLVSAPAAGALVSADFGVLWLCRFADDALDLEEFMATLFALGTVKLQTARP